jgi:hypothetical protein
MADKARRKRVHGEKNPCVRFTDKEILQSYMFTKLPKEIFWDSFTKLSSRYKDAIRYKKYRTDLLEAFDELFLDSISTSYWSL